MTLNIMFSVVLCGIQVVGENMSMTHRKISGKINYFMSKYMIGEHVLLLLAYIYIYIYITKLFYHLFMKGIA
jgi:hypothetical protein